MLVLEPERDLRAVETGFAEVIILASFTFVAATANLDVVSVILQAMTGFGVPCPCKSHIGTLKVRFSQLQAVVALLEVH